MPGTLVTSGRVVDNGEVLKIDPLTGKAKGLDVPSLLGLARSAPYLHTGAAATLEDRINNNPGDKHGVTTNLSAAQRSDLVAYLKTL